MKKVIFLLSLILTDQLSKYLILKNFSIGESLNLLPILDIYLILNTGIAFSLFNDGGTFGRWILVFLVFLVCLYLVYILTTEYLTNYESIALLMILSGGIGNLIDRTFRGYVVDFINFYYESYSFYIFNFADTFITIGVIVYLLDIFVSKSKKNGNQVS
ncbi:MAG: signal peptidase II [Gammaproteobacteria bacterium]|tara:strand:+ start:139 stop:615 length:477 start_codon:yes stop_codon:yes gene_type:complete